MLRFEIELYDRSEESYSRINESSKEVAKASQEIEKSCRELEASFTGGPTLSDVVAVERQRLGIPSRRLMLIWIGVRSPRIAGQLPSEFEASIKSGLTHLEPCREAYERAARNLHDAAAGQRQLLRAHIRDLERMANT